MSNDTEDTGNAGEQTTGVPDREDVLSPAAGDAGCECGKAAAAGTAEDTDDAPPAQPRYVYAIGTIEARFPTVSVEKEFAQVRAGVDTKGLTDREATHKVLSAHRYLAREMCWVLRVEGLETYILLIRDHFDLAQLVEALRPGDIATDRDIVIGTRGPLAGPGMCRGLVVPTVVIDQVYSFDIPGFLKSIPRPAGAKEPAFARTAEELFHRVMQMADNVGELAEHRALNYLAVRYPPVYALAAEMASRDAFLSAVDVRPDQLGTTRRIVRVIFTFTHRKTDVTEKYAVRVDVSEKWPFLASKLQPTYDV